MVIKIAKEVINYYFKKLIEIIIIREGLVKYVPLILLLL
jgi:hypothetical protein